MTRVINKQELAGGAFENNKLNFCGIEIQEVIVDWGEGIRKLIWAREEILKLVIKLDGIECMNPVFHSMYHCNCTTEVIEAVKRRVKEAFLTYWLKPQSYKQFAKEDYEKLCGNEKRIWEGGASDGNCSFQ